MKKVGIFGGTFNPVHMGHLLLAEAAGEAMGLDEVLFIPSRISYMKDQRTIISVQDRVAMTALAVEDNRAFRLSTIEADNNSYSYTCETLQELQGQNPDTHYFLIMGADSLFQIENWRKPEVIFGGCTIAVAMRPGHDEQSCAEKAAALQANYGADIRLLPSRMIDISATDIRERIRAGKSVRYLVPDKVLAYIERKQLYRPGKAD